MNIPFISATPDSGREDLRFQDILQVDLSTANIRCINADLAPMGWHGASIPLVQISTYSWIFTSVSRFLHVLFCAVASHFFVLLALVEFGSGQNSFLAFNSWRKLILETTHCQRRNAICTGLLRNIPIPCMNGMTYSSGLTYYVKNYMCFRMFAVSTYHT